MIKCPKCGWSDDANVCSASSMVLRESSIPSTDLLETKIRKLLDYIDAMWLDIQEADGDMDDWQDCFGTKPAFVEYAEMIRKKFGF